AAKQAETTWKLVFLGAAGVGKTALIHRFLQDTFEVKHRRTVEELHSREYEVDTGVKIIVEILDTSGKGRFQFHPKIERMYWFKQSPNKIN
uniref:Small monomeric GTPase n=1 Tax=Gadus morhua TaxID=8049 RepID=A0A8C5AW44_GADMO